MEKDKVVTEEQRLIEQLFDQGDVRGKNGREKEEKEE